MTGLSTEEINKKWGERMFGKIIYIRKRKTGIK
jgi:hypothetical protein